MDVLLELPIQSPPDSRSATVLRSQLSQPQRNPSLKKPLSPRPSTREVRFRRSPTSIGKDGIERPGTRGAKSKMRLSPKTIPKSLLPTTEQKSPDEIKLSGRSRKESDVERWDITPDGGSAGREGRQFTVSNVGNNGRIYLRPTIRPANQRYPQPNFVFPMTPPGTAGLETVSAAKRQEAGGVDDGVLNRSQWTASHMPSTPVHGRNPFLPDTDDSRRRRRRAMSDSTIQDASVARESDAGGFKIIITKPREDPRPKTLEDMGHNPTPLLDVTIPSWKLGTARFTLRGTPVIMGSSYAPTEEFRSSSHSLLTWTPRNVSPHLESFAFKKPGPVMLPKVQAAQLDLSGLKSPVTSRIQPQKPHPFRTTYLSTHTAIEPGMFDSLTFQPACNDRAIVRISSTTLAVTAATPPRLVAEITSPKFVDYELVSDFFLTFRTFLETANLLRMLIARLRWAMAREDEIGMIVRVRAFVALRHWILNYFMDDFVMDHNLRVLFCALVNEFVNELSNDLRKYKGQIKILGELKKCWRKVCAQYWDGRDFDATLGPDIPIAPGGIAGHRNPSLNPSFWEQEEVDAGPPQLDSLLANFQAPPGQTGQTSFYADVSRAGHIDSIVLDDRPATPENKTQETRALERSQTSPTSITSLEVVSCSFPSKNLRLPQPVGSYLAAHPVDPSSVYTHSGPIATTPRALMGKRVRPQPHKRNASLTDSLREHTTTAEKLVYKNAEFLMTLPYAGSLVRGAMFPPGQSFVEVVPPGTAGGPNRQTTIFQPHPLESQKERASAMSGQGMRKLLGSVRRALSTRGQVVSPTQGNFINISPIGPRGATTNRLPGTAIVPQARPRMNGVRPPVRIDLLGAEVAEDFKKAVREDAATDAAKQGYALPSPRPAVVPGELLEYSAAHMDTLLSAPDEPGRRPLSDAGITTGSKSIVIVDDTYPFDLVPAMAGALPAINSSVEAFAESFMAGGGGDPTPPNTPPGHNVGTPRRSSYILSQHVVRPSVSADDLPPFVPDMETLEQLAALHPPEDTTLSSEHLLHQSTDSVRSPHHPPLSGIRGHMRHRSSRSYKSSKSLARRRYVSFTNGITPTAAMRSFDATTYSGASIDGLSDVPMPQPLRVLRRRPGGDLRAVENIGELDPAPLRRSRSVGSLTTYTDSFRSSYIRSPGQDSSGFVDVVTSDYSREGEGTFSLGAIAEAKPKRQLSLFSTHSSKPVMRPSFEAEAQKLAQIPDDVDDDGGVESALLKLEGKFEKKKSLRLSMEPSNAPPPSLAPEDDDFVVPDERHDELVTEDEKREHRHQHVGDDVINLHHLSFPQPPQSGEQPQEPRSATLLSVPPSSRAAGDGNSFLSGASGESYSSIPLLERGLTDDVHSKTHTNEWADHSILQDDDVSTPAAQTSSPSSPHPSYEIVNKTDSMERMELGATMPAMPQSPRQGTNISFLDDESDNGSDLSSELSAEVVDEQEAQEEHVQPLSRSNTVGSKLPAHALEDAEQDSLPVPPISQPLLSHPPSPPMTLAQALQMSPETANIPELHDHQVWEEKPLPPTPDTSRTTLPIRGPSLESHDPTGTKEALRNAPKTLEADIARKFSVHLPFILAFDSDILAQQFTLIEKDALNEIDWRELIEMRWKNTCNTEARSWVDFLRNTDARGVEVVAARFNIMVKWAMSEIVLTQDIEERARCIIKYIHIAAHCRRYRNFATMSQITIALTSNEASRLTKTWAMVPPTDLKTLKDLEALVSPTRNFQSLRAEMEGVVGITAADTSCIPFVGIYTHDLIFNAQRPSEIASSPTTAPLVNFERCRHAASIVKTLLRLLEASTLYKFLPIEGITERCLWMGALKDEDIRKYSESLE